MLSGRKKDNRMLISFQIRKAQERPQKSRRDHKNDTKRKKNRICFHFRCVWAALIKSTHIHIHRSPFNFIVSCQCAYTWGPEVAKSLSLSNLFLDSHSGFVPSRFFFVFQIRAFDSSTAVSQSAVLIDGADAPIITPAVANHSLPPMY